MRHRVITAMLLVVALTLVIAPAAHAQYDDRWSAALLVTAAADGQPYGPVASADLILLAGSGSRTQALTSLLNPPQPQILYEGALDAQGQRAALVRAPYAADGQADVLIVDLATGTTYQAAAVGNAVNTYDGLTFSPDGSQIAAAFIIVDTVQAGIVIWDAASGAIVSVKSYADLAGLPAEEVAYRWPYLGAWTASGIEWHENCYACEGVFSGEWSLWDPLTNSVTPSTDRYFDAFFSDRLTATGEAVSIANRPQYPTAGMPGMFPASNVIHYTASGATPSMWETVSDYPVIFYDVAMRNLSRPLWIADGSAILAHDETSRRYAVIGRDGSIQHLSYEGESRPLFGTPSGWVSLVSTDAQTYSLVEFVPALGGIETIALDYQWDQPVNVTVVDRPELGTSLLSVLPPSPIAPPDPAQVESLLIAAGMSCPGLPVSRLYPGGLAIVTPGSPNNLRAEASAGSALLGQIPGGDIVDVVSGPVCDAANGLVWWEVNYQGTRGYTVESLNGQYALESMQF